jgi:DUF917 family protein
MKKISIMDLDDMALGATILGAGGGGDPAYDLLMTKQLMEGKHNFTLVELNEVKEDALIMPVAFMGAPLVCIEKLPSGGEFEALLKIAESVLGRKIDYLIAAEIGGGNAFTPLMVSAQLGIPVIDGDTLGRAFPELQMSTCNLKGISPNPAFLCDYLGNTVVINAKDGRTLERIARSVTVEMGSSSALGAYVMNGSQAKKAVIPGTVSRAIAIGKSVRGAMETGGDPLQALLEKTQGKLLGRGMIMDVSQSIEGGFLNGTFTIDCGKRKLKVLYQNEFLAVFDGDKPLASTPDIIIPIEQESGAPITSESLSYGLRVSLVAIPGPDIWKSPEGLKLVGPEYFGYNINYDEVRQ